MIERDYTIRAGGICACIVNISMEKFEQVIKEMAYYKMNELWIELKVESELYPEAPFWSDYTNEQAAHLAEFAARHHVELVPEVNSLATWGLGCRTCLNCSWSTPVACVSRRSSTSRSLRRSTSSRTSPPSTSNGSGSFQNYPQIIAVAREKFGPNATEHDLLVWFINEINEHVKSEGANLHLERRHPGPGQHRQA